MAAIAHVKIHPAIGIARLGNSKTAYFIGPEIPGRHPLARGGHRDPQGRIKRQAARFRLFGYDARGRLVKEVDTRDGVIRWTVHLANQKAAWLQFDGLAANLPFRNAAVANRSALVIDAGQRTLDEPNQAAAFDTGTFMGVAVPLGEIRTDARGRLLVLGGFGHSASPTNVSLVTFANNDGWHDDVSDGPVTATLELKGSHVTLEAAPAWVICPPPRFAAPIDSIITLYDTLRQVAFDKLGAKPPAKPSFSHDVFPLLQRAIRMQWVSGMVTSAHAHKTLAAVIPPPGTAAARRAIFGRLRDPALAPDADSDADMPMIWSDYYPGGHNQPLLRFQYEIMRKWKNGRFSADWTGEPRPTGTITPAGLDRAALEACVGGAFFPGIEASWMLRDTFQYSEPFRLDHTGLTPGDVTKQMAVPWQADFADCTQDGDLAWWPAQRPDDVYPAAGGPQVPWTRGLIHNAQDMVAKWHKLGFVVKKGKRFVEVERLS